MALRELVEGECGGSNPLVRLTTHIVQDRALKEEGFRHYGDNFSSSNADRLVQQYFEERLGQTTPTFRMDSLLAEMRDLERGIGTSPPVQSAPISQLAAEQDVSCWAEQYLEAGKHFQETNQDIWSNQKPTPAQCPNNDTFELGFGPNWAEEYLQSTSDSLDLDEPAVNLNELGTSEEYHVDATTEHSDLKATANEILNRTADDSRFNYSKFMKFMSQINEGSVSIENGIVKEVTDDFTTSFLKELEDNNNDLLNDTWTEARRGLSNSGLQLHGMKGNAFDLHPWSHDFTDYLDFTSTYNQYKFAEENVMSALPDAMAEGKKRKDLGDIPSAVLCFESAVKSDPQSSEAWLLLASTQAENEQDPQAIAAYKKCLELEPNNLIALMGLAVSLTNENLDQHACRALKDWLKANPKYSDLVHDDSSLNVGGVSMLSTMELHREMCKKFIAAARKNPQDIDPDVQCGLGVLFNLTNEQDKAVDCFKSALQVRPNDFTLWNRLGATLANGGRPEEAVDAYHNALQLYPGFIRARYNLGITCTHLGAHREAVEHFLSALTTQSVGQGLEGQCSANMSDTIWSTLHLVVSFMERPDLLAAVNDRNLDRLNKEFNVNENQSS